MAEFARKRKRAADDEWDSEVSARSDIMDIDDEDDNDEDLPRYRHPSSRLSRSLRSRDTTRQNSHNPTTASGDDDSDTFNEVLQPENTRRLRTRVPKPMTSTRMFFKNDDASQDQDELANDPRPDSSDREDGDFTFITSDLVQKTGRSRRAKPRSKRLQARSTRLKAHANSSSNKHKSPDSDIEFEAPRRSARSTRTKANMFDDALMDDDSFYVVDDKVPGPAKVISIREIFQPHPPDSSFASMHMETCHSCGGSKHKGQMVHCQGCTLSFHKNCLGYRSGRDHMVTKVREDNFVLQCRFCIGIYKKKDTNAPSHSMCQGCQGQGRACDAFSEKKTARQEEKLREQNDGIDPITPVSEELLNNADLVLFRCAACHRGWHVEHLPGPEGETINTDVKSERLKDYSVDWQCHECGTVKHKIHRLVAWRPAASDALEHAKRPSYAQVGEDDREYLIKWEKVSYAHCTWMPGAWVHGVAASAMRTAFGKRDAEQSLLKLNEKEAIPDEYLMPDVILNITYGQSATRSRTREDEQANINKVSKMLVKFQGLGYDDVVWDSPPSPDMGTIYSSYVEAYYEFLEGKYFQKEPQNKIRDRIKAFKAAPFTEVEAQPDGLKRGKLMGYQLEGLNWLLENYHSSRSVVLADEMGLGKTVQVVSLVTSLVQDKPKVCELNLELEWRARASN